MSRSDVSPVMVVVETDAGGIAAINEAFAGSRADVAIIDRGTTTGPDWRERLQANAQSDSLVATATAIANEAAFLSVAPTTHAPIEEAAAKVATGSLQLRPRIPTALPHCTYVRREAIDLVGGLDVELSLRDALLDFSFRCTRRGLVHIAADDVYAERLGDDSARRLATADAILVDRYPELDAVLASVAADVGPLARTLECARVALDGLSVTIDARCLGETVAGTQVYVRELIHALAGIETLSIRALVAPSIPAETRRELEHDGVTVLVADALPRDLKPTTIVHRPYQVAHVSELEALGSLGARFVLTQLDLITYRLPQYNRSPLDWLDYRGLTQRVLASADLVIFISQHAANDAIADDLVDAARVRVTHLAPATMPTMASRRPTAMPNSLDYLLCLGTNFPHKNRVFALELVNELRSRHGWQGLLVFAGPQATATTSEIDERRFITGHADLADGIVELGGVGEAEKAWLYEHAAGIVYPSVYEGFGLIPFEAAAHGRPTFFASQASLAETLPGCATLVPWDAAASADAVYPYLVDRRRRRELVDAIAKHGAALSWDRTANDVVSAYHDVLRLTRARSTRVSTSEAALPATGLSSLERRALVSALARPAVRKLILAPITAAFVVAYRARHGHMPGGRGID